MKFEDGLYIVRLKKGPYIVSVCKNKVHWHPVFHDRVASVMEYHNIEADWDHEVTEVTKVESL